MDINKLNDLLGKLSPAELDQFLNNLQQINFTFVVNNSFLKYNNHPLTIPKEFNPFLNIKESSNNFEAIIVFPDGSSAASYIHNSRSGWGEYFQIRIRSPYTGNGINVFRTGDVINVAVTRDIGKMRIILSH